MKTNGKIQLHPFARVAAALTAGMATAAHAPDVATPWAWTLLLVAFLLASRAVKRQPISQTVCLFGAVFCLGGALMQRAANGMTVALPDGEQEFEAVVIGTPEEREKTVRCDIMLLSSPTPLLLKAYFHKDERSMSLRTGNGVRAFSRLRPPANLPHSTFDYALYLRRHGYAGTTYLPSSHWLSESVSLRPLSLWQRARLRLLVFRQSLLDRYTHAALANQELAVVAAMTLGDKSRLSQQTKDVYSQTGASHILALSGLHLGIIYSLLTLRPTGRRRHHALHSALVLVAIWLFALLAGLPVSLQRAATMLTISSLSTFLHRNPMSINALSLSAVVMLACQPMSLFDVGFQLSFLSVLSILLLFGPFRRLLSQRRRYRQWLHARHPAPRMAAHALGYAWSFVSVSVAAQVGTAPLVALHFGQVAPLFLLTNLVAIPAAWLILHLAVLFFLLWWWLPAQALVVRLLAFTAALLNSALSFVASLPSSTLLVSLTPAQTLFIYMALSLLTSFFLIILKEKKDY